MLTQMNLAQNVAAVPYTAEPGCTLLSVLPVHHAFCLVMDWLKGFSLGAVVCINDSFIHMIRNMSIFKPDVMLMVPLMIETIYKRLASVDASIPAAAVAENVFGGKLKIIFTGGAHLDPFYIDKLEKYGVQVLEGYGMSECSPVISSNTPEDHKKGSIGRPLANVKVRFVDGEIQVQGSSVMKGYYKMPVETEETLKDDWYWSSTSRPARHAWYLSFNTGNQSNDYKSTNRYRVRPVSALIWKEWSRVKTYSKPTRGTEISDT